MTSNELTFHQFVDGISGLVAVLTPDGAVEFCNRQVLDYFGRTIEELKTWGSTDAVHPDDLPRVIAVWSASVESGHSPGTGDTTAASNAPPACLP